MHRGADLRRIRIVQPAQDDETAMPLARVEPVPAPKSLAPIEIRTLPSVSGATLLLVTELCRRLGSRHSCQMLSSVTFQYLVSGGTNSSSRVSSGR
jgi:hypothetical protein